VADRTSFGRGLTYLPPGANKPILRGVTFRTAGETLDPSVRSRLAAIEGQRSVIKEKVAQLEHQIIGGDAQVKAYRSQLESTRKDIGAICRWSIRPDSPPPFPAA
jgi:hypothetical protein